jgi:hypothetical protein
MDASARIKKLGLTIGGISFLLGFVGPFLFTKANTGPFLGIFITGPVGFLVGALLGIGWSLRHDTGRNLRTAIRWYLAIWLLSLLAYWFWTGIGTVNGIFTLAPMAFQVLAIVMAVALLAEAIAKQRFSRSAARCAATGIVAAVLMLMIEIYPPITSPSWDEEKASASVSLPAYAFFMDSHFDSNRHVPDYAVNTGRLVAQWLATAAVAGLVCVLNTRKKEDQLPIFH